MNEMNPIISWAINSIQSNDFSLPDNNDFHTAMILAGLPEEEIKNGKLNVWDKPLQSIFSCIELDDKKADDKFIPWQVLDANHFVKPAPDSSQTKKQIDISDTDKNLFKTALNDSVLGLALLERYTTFLGISPTKPYLTFFDTIKNAASIYSCIQKNSGKKQFLLVGGDLSGIQKYIFDLSEKNSKGVAKILRARSFYLGLFTEICKHYILHTLELPLHCTISDAGGRFVLLVHNNDKNKQLLKKLSSEIDTFCINDFYGELSLNIAFVDLVESDFIQEKLLSKIEQLNRQLEIKKQKMFFTNLNNNDWSTEKFILDQDYDNYEKGLCKATEKLPRSIADDEENEYSLECKKLVDIGQWLVKKKYIGYSNEPPGTQTEDNIKIEFATQKYYVFFLEKIDSHKYYLIQSIYGLIGNNYIPRYFANYVPKYNGIRTTDHEYYPYPDKPEFKLDLDPENKSPKNGNIIDFGTLAYAGIELIKDDNIEKYVGTDLLGVITADVDRMGQVFTDGIKNVYSISTYSTLSRQLDMFFTFYLPENQKKNFNYIYTVYAGGDDLFFIGEWQQAILFANDLYKKFTDYTGNKNLTISSAINIIKPNTPIRTAALCAEELLKTAKSNERDSMAFFDIVIKQNEFEKLNEMADFLNSKRREGKKSNINPSFLHRFLIYRQMAKRFYYDKVKNIKDLMYAPRLAYDISRNLELKDTKEVPKDEKEMLCKFTNLFIIKEMVKMQFPLSWAIYKNRKI